MNAQWPRQHQFAGGFQEIRSSGLKGFSRKIEADTTGSWWFQRIVYVHLYLRK